MYEGDCRPPTADCRLVYVGHTGTGFDGAELTRVWRLLKAREITESPFSTRLPTNERPHWVRPELVAQVRFTEWTDDNKLRHPVYLGLRDDKEPLTVVREEIRSDRGMKTAITGRRRGRNQDNCHGSDTPAPTAKGSG